MCVPRLLRIAKRTLLIGVCILLPLLTRNAAATATTGTGAAAATNYQRTSRSYDNAATAAAMTAAALPAAATAKDYSQQLMRYYQAPSAAVAVAARDVGAADVAGAPIYQNYFENGNVGVDKIGTLITRDQVAEWRLPAGSERTASATHEPTMTAAGFVPTTMSVAGQHYAASMSEAVEGAPADDDYSVNGGEEAGKGVRAVSADGDSYAYAPTPTGKIDYEINEDNYERDDGGGYEGSDGNDGVRHVAVSGGRATSLSADDAYEMYKYDIGDYAEHMQRALAASAGAIEGSYGATTDADGSNQGGSTYFEKQLPGYKNYFMPTYQIGQFSNYHNQEKQQQQRQQLEAGQQGQQESEQQKSLEQRHEQAQLRPLNLFDSNADDSNNAMLQQFNKGTNIENYANDKQKLRYYAKQPQQLQQEEQHQQQQQIQQQFEHQQQHHATQRLHKQIPEFMHFSLPQHLPHPQQRPVRVPAKATRPSDKAPLSARRRQQQQLQHQRRYGASLQSMQVIGNAARLSLLPTSANFHIDSDISRRGSNSNNNVAASNSDINRQRSSHDKRSISENLLDSTNAPSRFHYALTHARTHIHPAQLTQHVDDSVNEIDDAHNNIDDNVSGSDSDSSNRRGHHQDFVSLPQHHQHAGALVQQYTLPPITTTVRHTPASTAALAGIPLARHIELVKHIPTVTDYERIHVPFNQSVPIRIPHPVVTTIPRPYAIRVPVAKNVVVPKVQEVRIPVEKVKPFPVERPVPFIVERRVPYMVEKQVAKPIYYPYPVKVPIVKTIVHKVPRRHYNYATYPSHANSYPLSLAQYHLQQQHPGGTHTLPTLHYTQTGHQG